MRKCRFIQPVDGPRTNARQGFVPGIRSRIVLLALLGMIAGIMGCSISPYSYLAYPDTVYVPHPDRPDLGLSWEELKKMYTTSPNRDPDGLGTLITIELQSQMTLVVLQMELERERGNKTAYGRDDIQQQLVLDAHRKYHREHVVFTGFLLGNIPEGPQLKYYLPEGVYLLDDKGRRFLPEKVEEHTNRSYLPRVRRSEFGELFTGYPKLIFSKAAITAETKAITLYFADLQKRMAFTWIFDESYVPNRQRDSREHGKGYKRMWRNQ